MLGDGDDFWLQPGRYALRDAAKLGKPDTPASAWGVVLDGSGPCTTFTTVGPARRACRPRLWRPTSTGRRGGRARPCSPASGSTDVPSAAHGPHRADQGGLRRRGAELVVRPSPRVPPWSSDRVGAQGAVLIVTDGVPGDIDRLSDLAAANPGVRFTHHHHRSVALFPEQRRPAGLVAGGARRTRADRCPAEHLRRRRAAVAGRADWSCPGPVRRSSRCGSRLRWARESHA